MKKIASLMKCGMLRIKSFIKNEEGAEGIEWATILMVVVPILVIIIAIAVLFADEIREIFNYLTGFFADGGDGDILGSLTSNSGNISDGILPPS